MILECYVNKGDAGRRLCIIIPRVVFGMGTDYMFSDWTSRLTSYFPSQPAVAIGSQSLSSNEVSERIGLSCPGTWGAFSRYLWRGHWFLHMALWIIIYGNKNMKISHTHSHFKLPRSVRRFNIAWVERCYDGVTGGSAIGLFVSLLNV